MPIRDLSYLAVHPPLSKMLALNDTILVTLMSGSVIVIAREFQTNPKCRIVWLGSRMDFEKLTSNPKQWKMTTAVWVCMMPVV